MDRENLLADCIVDLTAIVNKLMNDVLKIRIELKELKKNVRSTMQ